jgi:DNA modification methylase
MPLEVMENIIKLLPEDKLIVDPFAGSGTTLLACQNLGRKYIGIEIDKKYIDIINKRLSVSIKRYDTTPILRNNLLNK